MSLTGVISFIPFVCFVALFVLQTLLPRRPLAKSGYPRIIHNLLLFVVNTILMRFVVPLSLIAVASYASDNAWGLFNNLNFLAAPLVVLVCVIALDFAIYWQHVATHKWEILWRLHKVHHADHDMDVTTAIRFHPIELVLSLVYKSMLVLLLGVPALAVIIFELLLFVGPAFNHSNVALPVWLDSKLRIVIATPDVHRAHHSTKIGEQNTNYGFFLIWWDRLFGTYTNTPDEGHVAMKIGLQDPSQRYEKVDQMLLAPFR